MRAKNFAVNEYVTSDEIKKIRKKTENSNVKTGYIETVWGAGYRFRVLNGKVDEEKESVINAI